ncbi:hypothetical protein DASC09_006550 [Saccharomycopsis crataegensis]|uniref:NADP-dependent oxidoreductase domain-containing protein n=1 Tax=Saccharomycopsis crataegensis TaxID=43959 RepID=A0AAV5QFV3_9ASCO|nr:hypothetical protein DASC09_006550 [Saccharomycopsis crataegensis]
MSKIEYWPLSNGVKVPAIGFGVGSAWRVQKQQYDPDYIMPELVESIEHAIDAGYDHIDSAEIYLTRKELHIGLTNKKVDRSKIFLTDKHFCGTDRLPTFTSSPYESLEISLKDLQTEYIDLYLLHSSNVNYGERKYLTNEEQWKHMEQAYKEGKARAIGVSNYSAESIEKLLKVAEIKPQALQIEFHAMCQEKTPKIMEFCKEHKIQVFAYAPLAPLTLVKEKTPLGEFVSELATKYGKTEAQIYLRWVSQSGVVPITTSGKVQRLKDARDIYSFKLESEDYEKIKQLGKEQAETFYKW